GGGAAHPGGRVRAPASRGGGRGARRSSRSAPAVRAPGAVPLERRRAHAVRAGRDRAGDGAEPARPRCRRHRSSSPL
ncbi:MAG: hypothetical protein AVDCRST_MAG11-3044, partial [uncultured Gemmatimonadaceae bacterium]